MLKKDVYYIVDEYEENGEWTTSPIVEVEGEKYILIFKIDNLSNLKEYLIKNFNNRILHTLKLKNEIIPIKLIHDVEEHMKQTIT